MDFLSALQGIQGVGGCPGCSGYAPMAPMGAMSRAYGPMAPMMTGQQMAFQNMLLQLVTLMMPLMTGRALGAPTGSPPGISSAGGGPAGASGASGIGGASQAQAPPNFSNPPGSPRGTHQSRGSGYYPHNSRMEGGYVDRRGNRLYTLQDYLAGRAPYVSVAMDKNLRIPYGTKLRIAELEKKYGRPIEFRVVDTGGAFTNRGYSRIDICTASRRDSLDPTINGPLTLSFG
ncbi:MAG: hypothetical protein AMXMBFR33_59990 [Candidatus Xenobia bacterium]|jgi:hypothetical protein